ncbi:MAG TPA: cytochrome c [Lacunisphaera sp.]|nr:cytochrome c [Lacunisphaera sp.]
MSAPSRPAPRSPAAAGRVLAWSLVGLLVLGLAGIIFLQVEKQPEYSPVARGAKLAESAGCFACHGRGDGEKRFNLRQAVPEKWTPKTNPTLWDSDITSVDKLVEWIANGVTAEEVERHKKLFIRMPAYKDRLKPDDIEAIAAWILAEGLRYNQPTGADVKLVSVSAGPKLKPDDLLLAGDRLSRRFGCYQCHGELGQGGVANPNSFKGYIPGFFGQDFLKLTANGNRAEIVHWLDHGRGLAIASGVTGRLAQSYVEGQAIQMPGYRDQLTAAEKELLADFMLALNKSGPLPAREIQRIVTFLDDSASH